MPSPTAATRCWSGSSRATRSPYPWSTTAPGRGRFPLSGIKPDGGVYDYTARYTAGSTEFMVPARLSPELSERVAKVAVDAHEALGLRDISRSDLIIDADGVVWFLEVNVAPGLTETSTVPLSIHAAGLDLGKVMTSLVQAAVDR